MHRVSIMDGDQFTPKYLSLNSNNKIPAIIDPIGPDGKHLPLWKTGAILIYLTEKSGKFLPTDPAKRAEIIQWLMWQMGGFDPMLGQFGFFYASGRKDIEDKRLLGVLDKRLDGHEVVAGHDYSIADIAIWPWVRVLFTGYNAGDALELESFSNALRWHTMCADRPASKIAVNMPPKPE